MNTKLIGRLSITILAFLAILILYGIFASDGYGEIDSVEKYVEYRTANQARNALGFIISFIFTVLITFLFASLYMYCKKESPEWSLFGLIFLPAFAVLSITIFSSQVTIMEQLFKMYNLAEYRDTIALIFKQFLPGTENVARGFLSLPFILLGIPAVIYGFILRKDRKILKFTGILIMVFGIGLIAGLIDLIADNILIDIIGFAGFISFLIALILLSIAFLRESGNKKIHSENAQ